MKIQEYPVDSRPREKAKRIGLENLENRELLALVLGNGGKAMNVLEVGDRIFSTYHSFRNMAGLSPDEFQKFYGIGEAKALILSAVFEIQRRALTERSEEDYESSEKLFRLYAPRLAECPAEQMIVVYYGRNNGFIRESSLAIRSGDSLNVAINDILREALSLNAKKVVLIHNHPSGNPNPSEEDVFATSVMQRRMKQFGIVLLDHLIVGKERYYSFRNDPNGYKIFL